MKILAFGIIALMLVGPDGASGADRMGLPLVPDRPRNGHGDREPHGSIELVWRSAEVPDGNSSLAAGDLDRDGLLDFVVQYDAWAEQPVLAVYEDDGTGSFHEVGHVAQGPRFLRAAQCATGDTDGDGLPEIIVSYKANANFTVFEKSPDSDTYLPVYSWSERGYVHWPWTIGLFVGDVDDDGLPDVVTVTTFETDGVNGSNRGLVSVHEYAGGGGEHRFRETYRFYTGSAKIRGAAMGDVDHDGDTDIVLGVQHYGWDIWRLEYDRRASAWREKKTVLDQRLYCRDPAIADLDHDGRDELVCVTQRWPGSRCGIALFGSAHDDSFTVAAWLKDPSSTISTARLEASPASPRAGRPGVIAAAEGDGSVRIWELSRNHRTLRERESLLEPVGNGSGFAFAAGPRDPGPSIFIANQNGISVYRESAPVKPHDPTAADAPRRLVASPNPFNPRTEIRFTLAAAGPVRLDIFDLGGRRQRSLADGFLPAGDHAITWDGRDSSGREAAAGTYLARLEFAGRFEVARLVLVK